MKNKISCVLANWNNFGLLRQCVDAIKKSQTVDTQILVTLNEYNKQSIEYLSDIGVGFVANVENLGTAAVDMVTPMINGEYVACINDDETVSFGWDSKLISVIESEDNIIPSALCIEPQETGNPLVAVDNLGDVTDYKFYDRFNEQVRVGKYNRQSRRGYNHPNLVKVNDWKAIKGYSLGLPFDHFGLGGYGLDDCVNWALWNYIYDKNLSFIICGNVPVFHQVSQTTKRLSHDIKNIDIQQAFVSITGMTTHEFRRAIGWGQYIS